MTSPVISTRTLPPSVTPESIRTLSAALAAREAFLRQLIESFERKYPFSLEEFNRRLAARQIPEHPAWEEAIEWGNAVDQLAQVELMRSIVSWLTSLLKPSESS